MEQIECSEMLAYKMEMLGNCPKETTLYSKHSKSLKSRIHTTYLNALAIQTLSDWLVVDEED